ncbi:MAG: TolC family protein [Bdellovibrionota bacterium]
MTRLMQNHLLLISTFILAGAPTFAAAADLAPFTIQESVSRALEKNPTVLQAREAVVQTEANQSFAFRHIFPTVNGTVLAAEQKAATNTASPLFGGDPYNQYTASINLTQPIYDSSVSAALRFSEKDVKIKNFAEEIAERTVTQSVIEAFYSVLLNERLLQIYKEAKKVDEDTLAIAQRYARIGRAQKLDVLQLQTQVALLIPKIAQTEDAMRTAAAQLATLIRSLDANAIRLQGAFVTPDTAWVKSMIEKSKKELPELLQARETVNQFEDTRDVQMAVYWPKLNFLANVQRQGYTKHDLFDNNNTTWALQLQLNVPIFAGLQSIAQRESLASQERQLELAETGTADTVSVAQIQTERDFQVAQTTFDASRMAAQYGIESLKEAQRTYRLQMINYLQYQNSEQAFLDAQSGYLQAKYNYIVALSKYFNALGVPSATLISKLQELTAKGATAAE